MSVLVDIAEAVKTTLNAASLSVAFTATRAYVVPKNLSVLSTLEVVVSPTLMGVRAVDMGPRHAFAPEIGIAIRKRVADSGEADALMDLSEEIVDLFTASRRLDGTHAVLTGVELRPIFDPMAYDNQGLFSSLILLTFRLTR